MPGAKNLPFPELIDKEKMFKSAQEIKQQFVKVGVDPTKPFVASCVAGKFSWIDQFQSGFRFNFLGEIRNQNNFNTIHGRFINTQILHRVLPQVWLPVCWYLAPMFVEMTKQPCMMVPGMSGSRKLLLKKWLMCLMSRSCTLKFSEVNMFACSKQVFTY